MKLNKEFYEETRDDYVGPIRRALGGRKDEKGRTILKNQYKDLQILFDLLIAVCSYAIAFIEYENLK